MSFVTLTQCDGPPCTRCGCRDVDVFARPKVRRPAKAVARPADWAPIKDPKWYGWGTATLGSARCKHCGTVFAFKEKESPPATASPLALPGIIPQEIPLTLPAIKAPQTESSPAADTPQSLPPSLPDATPAAEKHGDGEAASGASVCLKCGGQFHTYKTRGVVQYRRCKKCGHKGQTFKE